MAEQTQTHDVAECKDCPHWGYRFRGMKGCSVFVDHRKPFANKAGKCRVRDVPVARLEDDDLQGEVAPGSKLSDAYEWDY